MVVSLNVQFVGWKASIVSGRHNMGEKISTFKAKENRMAVKAVLGKEQTPVPLVLIRSRSVNVSGNAT
jgi:hypothetical protein